MKIPNNRDLTTCSRQLADVHAAVHEAGHAVIGTILGEEVCDLKLLNDRRAYVQFYHADHTTTDTRILITLAGAHAEIELLGNLSNACNRDDAECIELLNRRDAKLTAKKAMLKATKLARKHREEILIVALALIQKRKLTGAAMRKLMREHYDIAD